MKAVGKGGDWDLKIKGDTRRATMKSSGLVDVTVGESTSELMYGARLPVSTRVGVMLSWHDQGQRS